MDAVDLFVAHHHSFPAPSPFPFPSSHMDHEEGMREELDDEGEVMLHAMILLQLNGVKLPSPSSEEEGNERENKKKRQRTSPDQLALLEQIFQTDKMPNQQTRVNLADQLGMSSRRVQIWFQNKRAKVKRSATKPEGEESPNLLRRGSLSSSTESLSPPSSPMMMSDGVPSPQSPPLTNRNYTSDAKNDDVQHRNSCVVTNNNIITANALSALSNATPLPLPLTLSAW